MLSGSTVKMPHSLPPTIKGPSQDNFRQDKSSIHFQVVLAMDGRKGKGEGEEEEEESSICLTYPQRLWIWHQIYVKHLT